MTASALFKPDLRISRIRLTQILSGMDMHSEFTMRPPKQSQAEAMQVGMERLAFRGTEGALTPTLQVTSQPAHDEPVQLPERSGRLSVAEVIPPPIKEAVHVADQVRDGNETSLHPEEPDRRQCSLLGGR